MPQQRTLTARIIEVGPAAADGTSAVGLVVGDRQGETIWDGLPPSPGDIFLLANDHSSRVIDKIGSSAPGAWSADSDALRWRRSRRALDGQTRMQILRRRHAIRKAVRDYLDAEDFLEIDAPLLVHGASPDAAIQSFPVGDRFLVSSTEYQIKRLATAGFDRLYTLTQNFRMGDQGLLHNPEFTMLEWARVGEPLERIEEDAEQMVIAAHLAQGGTGLLSYGGRSVDLERPWTRLTVAEAIAKTLGISMPDFSIGNLKSAVLAAKIKVRESWAEDPAFLFSLLLDYIQQFLGFDRPVFLRDWPSFLTSSALEKTSDIAERSELFIAGLELADGFPSLTDHQRQQRTFEDQIARRKIEGAAPVTLDERYLEALRIGLPSGAGMALGFDRLVMLLTDQAEIRQVMAFAWDEV